MILVQWSFPTPGNDHTTKITRWEWGGAAPRGALGLWAGGRGARLDHRGPSAGAGPLDVGPRDFDDREPAITEEEARAAAGRCLDCGVCSECHQCVPACPAGAIDLGQRGEDLALDVGAVVVATGYGLFPADLKPQYGYGRLPNVITGMQMERLLAPTRPYTSLLRPSDGRMPVRIAYVMCTGSRDESVGSPLCSTSGLAMSA